MKKHLRTILPIALLFIGLSLLLYPTVSDYVNSRNATRAIVNYEEHVSSMDPEEQARFRAEAEAYNAALTQNPDRFHMTDSQRAVYEDTLNVTGTGIMGHLEIPKLGVSLPIYHGTDEAVLQVALGHIEGTSLPVGGPGTHSAVSGHRGLPSARLLTDLNDMETGDVFYLHILGETMAYEVDQIVTVLPDELEELAIREGEDLCTLVTCTPYGVNTHRLLVRGHRVAVEEPVEEPVETVEETGGTTTVPLPGLAAGAALLALLAALAVFRRHSRDRKSQEEREL